MRYFIILIMLFFSTSVFATVDWDLLNEDCAVITDWTDNDTGDGVSSQITFDSKETFKFLKPTADTNDASRYRSITFAEIDYTMEWMFYFDNIGTQESGGNYDGVQIQSRGATNRLAVNIGTDGLYVNDGTSWNLVSGISIVQDAWHKFRFEVHNSQTDVDIYIDDVLMASDVDCSNPIATAAPNIVVFFVVATTVADTLVYTDFIRADTGVGNVFNDIGIRFYDGSDNIKIGTLPVTASHKLRIDKGGTTYGVPLVATGASDDSNIRIYDGSTTKSLPKLD